MKKIFKQHEYVCRQCGELRNAPRFVRSEEKLNSILCPLCQAESVKNLRIKHPFQAPNHQGSLSQPRSVGTHTRQAGDAKAADNSNKSWNDFKQSYKDFDLNVGLQGTYYLEGQIPSAIQSMTSDEVNSRVSALTQELNILRSRAYHIERREMWERQEKFNKEQIALNQALSYERQAKDRVAIGKKLKGPAKEIYRRTGKLPNEFMIEILALFKSSDKSPE